MYRRVLVLTAAVIACQTVELRAQDAERSESNGAEKKLQADSLARARSIRMAVAGNGAKVELVETPILRFGDAARKNDAGSVWVWGQTGRPRAVAEVYRSTSGGGGSSWIYVMSLSSPELVQAETDAGHWSPQTSSFDLKEIEGARAPSENPAVRLRQMKAVVRQLSAHEFWDPDNTRYDLRLLVTPLYRYKDAENGITDGAIFAFAHGTNPEILVFVEAGANESGAGTWSLGFVPLGSAELVVTREKETLWQQPRAPGIIGGPTTPYWLFSVADAASRTARDTPKE